MAALHLAVWNLLRGPRGDRPCRRWSKYTTTGRNILLVNVLAVMRFETETQNDGSVVAWTDGGCVCNLDARFRGAGCGIFGDDRDRFFTLLGHEQTKNGAELLAAIATMRVQDGNLEIMSDSEYVVRISTGLLEGERQLNTEGNADLWAFFFLSWVHFLGRSLLLSLSSAACAMMKLFTHPLMNCMIILSQSICPSHLL